MNPRLYRAAYRALVRVKRIRPQMDPYTLHETVEGILHRLVARYPGLKP